MSNMKRTEIPWLPEISEKFSVGFVKQFFEIIKDLSDEGEPERVLKLARSGIVEKDVTTNEGQMAASYAGYNKVQIGDLLLNPMDLYSGANCNVSELVGVISPAYSNLRAKDKNKVVPKYYDYYFKTQYWLMGMFAHGKGVSFDNRWTINNDTLKAYEIPLVAYTTQQRIVDSIKENEKKVDALITNQEAQIEKLKAYKQSLITEVVTKGLDPNVPLKDSGMEWVESIPEHWETVQLSSVVTERKHKNTGMIEDNLLSLSYGYIKRKDIKTSDGLLPESFEGYNIVEKGDIVLRLTDLQNDHTSLRTGLCNERGIITSAYVTLQNKGDVILSEYLHYVLHAFDICKGFYGMGAGVRQGLNYDGVKKVIVLKPSLSEQKEICEFIAKKEVQIERLIAIKKQKIEKLNQYKKSLIYEYVTGKKEV